MGDLSWRVSQHLDGDGVLRPDRRPLVAAAVLGIGSAVFGLRLGDALLIGLTTLALGIAWVSLSAGRYQRWPEVDTEQLHGTRREVSVLTWSFARRDGLVSEAGVRRLRQMTVRRLARTGLPGVVLVVHQGQTLDGDAERARQRARELLGERAWATVTGRGGWLPTLADVSHCLDVLEGLVPDGRRGSR